MHDRTISDYLDRLSAREPTPGGGAVAALHAAQGAALLGMVARYSTGPAYAAHAEAVAHVTAESDRLRARALDLAEEDARAFGAVTDAYRLPRADEAQKAGRARAVAAALAGAARPPAEVAAVAADLVTLAETLLPVANRNVISDIAAAADAARAAATTARINIEINLAALKTADPHPELSAAIATVDPVIARADAVTASVREAITS